MYVTFHIDGDDERDVEIEKTDNGSKRIEKRLKSEWWESHSGQFITTGKKLVTRYCEKVWHVYEETIEETEWRYWHTPASVLLTIFSLGTSGYSRKWKRRGTHKWKELVNSCQPGIVLEREDLGTSWSDWKETQDWQEASPFAPEKKSTTTVAPGVQVGVSVNLPQGKATPDSNVVGETPIKKPVQSETLREEEVTQSHIELHQYARQYEDNSIKLATHPLFGQTIDDLDVLIGTKLTKEIVDKTDLPQAQWKNNLPDKYDHVIITAVEFSKSVTRDVKQDEVTVKVNFGWVKLFVDVITSPE